MRILLVSSRAYPEIGGIENSLYSIGAELVRMGHDVKQFCFRTNTEVLQAKYNGIEIIRCPFKTSRWPHLRFKRQLSAIKTNIRPVLKQFEPDMIWSRSQVVGLGAVLGGYKGRIFHIFPATACMNSWGTCIYTKGAPVKQRIKLLVLFPLVYFSKLQIERKFIKVCQPICFSEMMRQHLINSYGLLAEKTQVVRPGIDSERFSPEFGLQSIEKIKKKFGLKGGEPVILYVGRLSTEKNIYFLLDSFKLIRSRSRLVLVGDGSEKERITNYIEKNNLKNKVILAGAQSELLPGFYSLARVCVLPTIVESFGQVYLESMACGTPVVGFAGDGKKVLTATEEIIEDGVTGRVVHKITPKALAEGINDILSMSELEYQTMSKQAVAEVRKRFTWERFVEEMLAISNLS